MKHVFDKWKYCLFVKRRTVFWKELDCRKPKRNKHRCNGYPPGSGESWEEKVTRRNENVSETQIYILLTLWVTFNKTFLKWVLLYTHAIMKNYEEVLLIHNSSSVQCFIWAICLMWRRRYSEKPYVNCCSAHFLKFEVWMKVLFSILLLSVIGDWWTIEWLWYKIIDCKPKSHYPHLMFKICRALVPNP